MKINVALRPTMFVAAMLFGSIALGQSLEGLSRLSSAKTFRVSSCNANWRSSNVDFRFIRAGQTLTLANLKGPGKLTRLWMTILPSQPAYSRLLTLRIYWDGEKTPSVECPIGDFFGVGHGVNAVVNSVPVRASAEGRGRSCNWVMPFRKSARVTVSNDGTEATWGFYYQVDGEYGAVDPKAPYFHASYRQEFPCAPGDYLLANIKGEGHYVGSVISVRSTAPGWWGEGNDYFFVDGAKEPTLRGTGFEDYFGEAWALRETQGPYEGCSLFEGGYPGARSTCYRWHVGTPVRFKTGLKATIQHQGVGVGPTGKHGNNIERPDEYSSVAFWYQREPHAPFPKLPAGMDRLPFDYRTIIEGESLKVSPTSGKIEVAKVGGLNGGAQLEWSEMADGAELNLPFKVSRETRYQVMVLYTSRWDGNLAQFLIDGEPIGGRVSFYSEGFSTHHELPFEFRKLKAGEHVLTLRNLGKAPENQGDKRWFSVDGFIVQPLRPEKK